MSIKKDLKYLCKNIRFYRKNKNMKIHELAQKVGLFHTGVSLGRIERGVNYPSVEILFKISEVLGVPLDWFFLEKPIVFNKFDYKNIKFF